VRRMCRPVTQVVKRTVPKSRVVSLPHRRRAS